MSYTVSAFRQGRLIATGEAYDISKALKWADLAISGIPGEPRCDEVEVKTTYKGREILVAWVMDDDRALEEV